MIDDTQTLTALHERGDALVRFADCMRQANQWMSKNGTQGLADELRAARSDHRMIRLGMVNTLILLAHIDRLEAELAKHPVVKP